MVCADDVANWFNRIFLADAVLPGLVPGFIAADRANEDAAYPYGIISIEMSGDANYNSGSQEWKNWTLTLTVYGDQNTTANSSAIQQRVNFVYPENPADDALRNSGEFVFLMIPQVLSAKPDSQLRQGNDVILNKFAWKTTTIGDVSTE